MKKLLFLIAVLISNILHSQKKENTCEFSIKKMYKIEFAGMPRAIELIETTNSDFKGFLKITFNKEDDFTNKEITKEISISKSNVKELMEILENMGIESITNCQINDDCKYFLDGDSTTFKIITPEKQREYGFIELSNEDLKTEAPTNRKQAQKILNFIDKRLNLKNQYQKIKSKFPSGRYSYFSGNSVFTFEIE